VTAATIQTSPLMRHGTVTMSESDTDRVEKQPT